MMRLRREIAAGLMGVLVLTLTLNGCGKKEENPDIVEIPENNPNALPVLAQNEIYKTNNPVNVPAAAPIQYYKEGEKTEKPVLSAVPASAVSAASQNTRVSTGD